MAMPEKDVAALWAKIEASGLAPDSYDKEFVGVFVAKLGLRLKRSVKAELRRVQPSMVDFLSAFLTASQPFDQMAQDVWRMFITADARFGEENLQIAFDFKDQPEGLTFDLEHFKAFVEEYRRFRDLLPRIPSDQHVFWKARDFVAVKDRSVHLTPSAPVADWATAYDGGTWLPVPQLPPTGQSHHDLVLERARAVIVLVVERLAASGRLPGERPDLYEERTGISPEDDLMILFRIDHDRWARTFLVELDQLADRLVRDPNDAAAHNAINGLGQHLQQHIRYESEETLGRQLEAFLNLPIWKARDQLFGLWVCAEIARAVEPGLLTFHAVNGGLRFRFKATHVATIRSEPPLYLVAELRTPGRNLLGKGRKRGIQPDWRLVREPLARKKSAQVLIIECKQYAKPSRKNFLEAAVDYARNSGDAKVAVVNYGDMDAVALTSEVKGRLREPWRKVRHRVALIGGLRPAEADAQQRFNELVAAQVPPSSSASMRHDADPAAGSGTISLWWNDSSVDLDLIVRTPFGDVSYKAMGKLDAEPWIKLEADVTNGGDKPEIVRIAKWLPGRHQVWIHNYSRAQGLLKDKLNPKTIELNIDWNGTMHSLQRSLAPWLTWHAFNVDGPSGHVEIVDTIA